MKKTDPFACPVCGMDGDLEAPPETHNGIHYYFCSGQCRERFLDHPALFSLSRRSRPQELPKRRLLRLATLPDEAHVRLLSHLKDEMMGILETSVNGLELTIEYDLRQATLAQIEAHLARIGIDLSAKLTDRLKRAWLNEREETELAILAEGKRPCCNEPPHGH